MKAKLENGIVVYYNQLPTTYKSDTLGLVLAGFETLDKDVIESEGFYDVVTPDYDVYTEELSDIYFDDINKGFEKFKDHKKEDKSKPLYPQMYI